MMNIKYLIRMLKTVAFRNILFHFTAFICLLSIFVLFYGSYKQLKDYTALINRNNAVQNGYLSLSRYMNIAAIINPALLNSPGHLNTGNPFYTDMQAMLKELASLQSVEVDPVNLQIINSLTIKIKVELSRILKNNVPDSIVYNKPPLYIASFKVIRALIDQGSRRTDVLIKHNRSYQDSAISRIMACMILFALFSGLLVLYKVFRLSKQQTKTIHRFEALVKNSDDIIVMLDENMNMVYRSPSALRITGYTVKDRKGSVKLNDIHPEDREKMQACFAQVKAVPGKIIHTTYRIKHKKGHYVWIEGTFNDLRHDPDVKAIVANMRDITKRMQEEQRLKLLESVITNTNDIVLIMEGESQDGAGPRIVYVNEAFTKVTGYASEEVIGQTTEMLRGPKSDKKELERLKKSLRNRESCEITTIKYKKNGDEFWSNFTMNPVADEYGRFTHWISIEKDITEKKELETLLNKANSLARLGGWELDLIKGSIYWSNITREIHEVTSDFKPDLATVIRFYKEGESRNLILKKVEESIEKGGSWDAEVQIITASGNEKWVRTMGETEFKNGVCIRLNGSLQDIDDRKKAETELQKSMKVLEDYTSALNQSSIIIITDENGVIQSISDNFCKISKYSREELIGHTQLIKSRYHSENFFKDLWCTISSGKTWRGEINNTTKDGDNYWVYTTITPFLDQNNKPFQYLAICFDITEKKLAEDALLNTLHEKKIILESIGDAFFALDKNWMVTYWNSQAEKMLGIPKDAIIGHNLWDVFSYGTGSASYRKYHQAVETNQVMHFEDYYPSLNKWYEVSAYPSGSGLSVYLKDVTERKHSEIRLNTLNKNLRKQARELAISNSELEQFAYIASHDLQEPLRMVTGFLSQLEKKYAGILDDKGKKYIEFAVDGARRMRQIILDLLEFSRVGRLEKNAEKVDLNELVNEIQILLGQQIQEKNAVIETAKLPSINLHKAPLRQTLHNLISNALKYSNSDVPVHIRISGEELPDVWKFSIEDNGIGIHQEYFEKIFIIFQRLHNKDQFSGTGIGLAICKKIVESLGGQIWVKSTEGEGSTFYFTVKK